MMLKNKARAFIGALSVTLILIGMVCGFILVDLSSDRYMPGMFAPIYLINEMGAQGVFFYWMGQAYHLPIERVKEIQAAVWAWRGMIPRAVRLAGSVTALLHAP